MEEQTKGIAFSSLQLAAAAGRIGFWSFDPETGFHWDESFYRLMELNPSSDFPRLETLLRNIPPEDHHILVSGNGALRSGRPPKPFDEFRYVGPAGHLRWIQIHRARVPDTGQYVGLFQDVTDQHLASEQIKASEARLALAASAAGLGIWDWDLIANTFIYSERAKEICGFPPGRDVTYEDVIRVTHPDDLPVTSAQAHRAIDPNLRDRTPYRYRIVRPDGIIRHVVAHGEAVFRTVDGVEKAIRYTGTLQDITDQLALESKSAESMKRLQLAIEAGRMAVWNYDFQTHTISGSPELNRLFGYPDDARPTPEDFRSRYFPGERERVFGAFQKVLEAGETYGEIEYRIVWPDGSLRWLLMRAELHLNANGQPRSAIGVLMDITDRKLAQQRVNVLMREVNHRSKNLLSVVQAIARQSASGAATRRFAKGFSERLQALAANQDLLIKADWKGINLSELAGSQLGHFADQTGKRIRISGPGVNLSGAAAQMLGLAFHELGTNAAKYGSLSNNTGVLELTWTANRDDNGLLEILWQERGGPPVRTTGRKGFGTTLITTLAMSALNAEVEFDMAEAGVTWRLTAPLTSLD